MAGLSYAIHPQLTLLSHSIATAIEISWTYYYNSIKSNTNWLIELINNIPITKISFAPLFGLMLHLRVLHPWLTPKFVKKLMSYSTNKR